MPNENDIDQLAKSMESVKDEFRWLGALAVKCAMVGNMDIVFSIRGAFDGVVKTAETTGGILDGLVELKDQFHV